MTVFRPCVDSGPSHSRETVHHTIRNVPSALNAAGCLVATCTRGRRSAFLRSCHTHAVAVNPGQVRPSDERSRARAVQFYNACRLAHGRYNEGAMATRGRWWDRDSTCRDLYVIAACLHFLVVFVAGYFGVFRARLRHELREVLLFGLRDRFRLRGARRVSE